MKLRALLLALGLMAMVPPVLARTEPQMPTRVMPLSGTKERSLMLGMWCENNPEIKGFLSLEVLEVWEKHIFKARYTWKKNGGGPLYKKDLEGMIKYVPDYDLDQIVFITTPNLLYRLYFGKKFGFYGSLTDVHRADAAVEIILTKDACMFRPQ